MCNNFDTLQRTWWSGADATHLNKTNSKNHLKYIVFIHVFISLCDLAQRHLTASEYIYLGNNVTSVTGEELGKTFTRIASRLRSILSRFHTNSTTEIRHNLAVGTASIGTGIYGDYYR